MKLSTDIEELDYYECPRCELNSEDKEGNMCPCPRGGCEAKIIGTITKTTITELNKELTPEQIQWNKENYR